MMETFNLHDRFLEDLKSRFSAKEIKQEIANILGISLDAAYRRLNKQVLFTPREIGILCKRLDVSLDRMIHTDNDLVLWMPFILEFPLQTRSIDDYLAMIDYSLNDIWNGIGNTGKVPKIAGVYSTLPLQFFIDSPVLTKFMFFKWGYNLINSDEFEQYSNWQPPEKLSDILDRIKQLYLFDNAYYLWDTTLIWSLLNDLDNLYFIRVMTKEEVNEVAYALKDILIKVEKILNGTHAPSMDISSGTDFYVCDTYLGFTSIYLYSDEKHLITFYTSFSFSIFQDKPNSFLQMKNWLDSFRNISTQLSGSGRIVRRLFFDRQQQILDQFIKR